RVARGAEHGEVREMDRETPIHARAVTLLAARGVDNLAACRVPKDLALSRARKRHAGRSGASQKLDDGGDLLFVERATTRLSGAGHRRSGSPFANAANDELVRSALEECRTHEGWRVIGRVPLGVHPMTERAVACVRERADRKARVLCHRGVLACVDVLRATASE